MRKNNEIFKDAGKALFNVPESYFNDLKTRLDGIPGTNAGNVGVMRRLKPYLALAACFLAIMCVGNLVLRNTANRDMAGDYYNEAAYADLMTMPEDAFHAVLSAQDTISDEDVVNYLISSGTSAELIEYTRLIAKK